MNINSTSSVDNTSIANLAKGSVGQSGQDSASAEPSSFLDKLTALLFSAKSDTQTAKHNEASIATVVSSDETSSELSASEPSDERQTFAESDSEHTASFDAAVDVGLTRAIAEPQSEPLLENKSTQVMNEGDDLLVRLQQANQVLTGHNGKPLPHSLSAKHDDAEIAVPVVADQYSHSDDWTSPIQTQVMYGANTLDNSSRHQYGDDGENERNNTVVSHRVTELETDLASMVAHPELTERDAISNTALTTDIHLPIDSQPTLLTDELDIDPSLVTQATHLSANPHSQSSSGSIDGDLSKVEGHIELQDGQRTKKAVAVGVSAALATQSAAASPVGASQTIAAPVSTAMSNPTSLDAEMSSTTAVNRAAGQAMAQPDLVNTQAANAALVSSMLLAGAAGKTRSASDSDDTSLAQQIAATATQSGVSSSTPLRHEATPIQAQPLPLMLNKGLVADEMAERIQMMMSKNLKNIDIRLDPPELGRLHIRMNMHADGASIQFTVTNAQARDALEGAMPRLREMLAQQGVQLADTSVQQQSSGQQQGYAAERGQSGHLSDDDTLLGDENIDANVKLDLNVTTKRDGISYYA
ncbi:flagellar hook-length control protein FliK [Vibrio metschnikovii]|uniref:flagellar hook-length control protein FliK n=1 Tax=Vibrio metschnikovii TaxID=28172 RepID=UPI00315D52E4|nr:flagellar hook-length control protein FliK [Vibrio metschnikovii]EKO3598212.1 flagellar hook-length control protein FliK [Vibrio metschnikovii]EKO3710075.1 flagellar hook-length control protein FliK [Vibrio metschnikovii]EKO3730691.1 flagellar hook-length control protein FliK [Vibrio metschnikovii]